MTPRVRLVLALTAATTGLAGAALTPWSIGTERAASFVGEALARSYHLSLAAAGPTTLVLLPAPRLTFGGVTLRDAAGRVLAEAESLSAALGLGALAAGRAEVTEIAARRARIAAPTAGGPWADTLALLEGQLEADVGRPTHLHRITLADSTLVHRHPRTGAENAAEAVDLTLAWPRWSAAMEIAGSFTWAGAPVRVALSGLRPGDLFAGRGSPATLALGWPSGTLTAEGNAALGPGRPWGETRWRGNARLDTRSLRESLAWLRLPAALGPLVDALAVETDFEAGADGVVMPRLRARVAGAVLDGAGGAGFAGGRLAISGTLATETIDLTRFLAPVAGAFVPGVPWGQERLDLAEATGGDLDLRLSASAASVGPLRFEDVAASVRVKEGEVETAVGRATLQGGTLKGRVTLAAGSRGTEMRVQGAVQRVDLGALLVDLGQYRWVQGTVGGQVSLESTGATAGELAARLAGRAALAVENGELAGVSLEEIVKAEAGRERRLGRTPFERLQLSVAVTDGVGEITEGSLKAPAVLAGLRGRVSLPERNLAARAEVAAREGTPARSALFDIAGPWDQVLVGAAPDHAPAPFGVAKPWSAPPAKGPLPAAVSAFSR